MNIGVGYVIWLLSPIPDWTVMVFSEKFPCNGSTVGPDIISRNDHISISRNKRFKNRWSGWGTSPTGNVTYYRSGYVYLTLAYDTCLDYYYYKKSLSLKFNF